MMKWIRPLLLRPAIKLPLVIGITIALLLGAHYARIRITHNFEVVIPGEIFRSSQLHSGDLQQFEKTHGIKAVLNLRGENDGAPWYEIEIKDAKEAGIEHLNFKMKASRQLTREQAAEVLEIIEKAPKPLLIHCQGGADRSGLVSALVLAARGRPHEESHAQLSISFGHLPSYGTDAMCVSLKSLLPFVSERS